MLTNSPRHSIHPQRKRREILRFAAVCIAGVSTGASAQERVSAPWSSGTEPPSAKVPANTADCHHHIYDSRFPVDPKAVLRPENATVPDYRLLQKRLGATRNVIVQPSTYGVDNRCLLDALRRFGSTARGVAVVNTEVSDAALMELQAAGVRGIRFNLAQAGATTPAMIEPLAKRVADLGWHVQINASPEQILALMPVWSRLPIPLVFDHLAHASSPAEPVFPAIAGLLRRGKYWVKLSGAYIDTKVGAPTYADTGAVVRAYIKEAPERLVWGTDWPHPTMKDKPDDALLFDLMAQWSPDETLRTRILVDNPAKLYGFS
jgi:predicted TIM-barrel fold metal-dependent hydrolase